MNITQHNCTVCNIPLTAADIATVKKWHAKKGICINCTRAKKKPDKSIDRYTNDNIDIVNNDGLSYMKTVKDSSVDMVLTDPPYVISRKTGFKSSVNGVDRLKISMDFGEWDKDFTLDALSNTIQEYYRVLRKGGYVIIFYDLWKIQELSQLLTDAGFKQLRFIEWIKTNPVPINSKVNYLTNSREVAICAVKGGKPTFNNQYDNGVYSYPIYHSKDRFHPTQKPPELFKELILKHTNKGDVVLDTFLGSGTTAVACMATGRSFKGCERDGGYYKQIVSRVNNNGKQTTI
jgi:site-specific DNA-methyltransferase (adenine-specific)